MALTVFYITNNLDVSLIAEKAGVNRIFVDLETLGKEERQDCHKSGTKRNMKLPENFFS